METPMIHIGISGPIASGKSTLAADLKTVIQQHNYRAEIIPFAYGIREIVALENHPYRRSVIAQKLFDWGYDSDKANTAARLIDEYMYAYPSQAGIKNRRLLQLIGTEVGRQFLGEDTWIIRTQQLAFRYDMLDFLISDDLRFDNEAMAVDVHIAVVVKGAQAQAIYQQRMKTFGADYTFANHQSEQSLTLPPLYTVYVGFDITAVQTLFQSIDRIRRLR